MGDISKVYDQDGLAKHIFPQFQEHGALDFVPTYHRNTYPAIDAAKANLHGKSVFITGSSYGLGRAMAISYAKAGASVIALAARSSFQDIEKELEEAATAAGKSLPTIVTYQLDVTDATSIEKTVQEYSQRFPSLDILVNNAGFNNTWEFTDTADSGDWWRAWEVNVKGTWLVTKHFLPLLLKSELRTLVLITSVAATLVAAGGTAYPITKLAVARMAEVLATEYQNMGLIAFALNPGDVPTDLSRKLPGEASRISQDQPELGADVLVFWTKERRPWLAGRFITANWDVGQVLEKKSDIVTADLLKFRLHR